MSCVSRPPHLALVSDCVSGVARVLDGGDYPKLSDGSHARSFGGVGWKSDVSGGDGHGDDPRVHFATHTN